MNRHMSDEEIITAFSILRSCKIRTNGFNILGMIGETPQTILKTIKLNALTNPYIVFNAYFYPVVTPIYAIQENFQYISSIEFLFSLNLRLSGDCLLKRK